MPPFDPDTASDPHAAGVLHKVRSLLAKAESTTFPDEAEALTAKAQQLMDRHAIDRAVLASAGAGGTGLPEGRRVVLDRPYVRPKFQLLAQIAGANRCRSVLSLPDEVATVIGFPDDQETVEVLYTSLLVQATAAMLREGSAVASARGRGFRHAFLVAYAARIGQRLQEAAAAVVAEADRDHGGSVLPVLASRADAVEAAVAREFPDTRRLRTSVSDPRGIRAGRAAADRADLATPVGGGRRRPLGR